MYPRDELHVVFGTGPVGLAVMRELLVQGKRVRLVNRSGTAAVPESVEVVKANAADPNSTRQVCRDATVVYNCVNAPYTDWATLLPTMHTAILQGAAMANAKLVVAENLYMYGPVSGSITEDLPSHPTTRKGWVRAQMAEELMAAHRAGTVRATSGRASDFYGPGAGQQGIFGDRVILPLLAGKTVSMLGKLDTPHTYTYVPDFGKGLVLLGTHDEALGQTWHIPNAPTLTTRQILTLFFQEAHLRPQMGSIPDLLVRTLGLFNPLLREVAEMLYEFNEPFVVESSKFVQAFGDIATPHREAIQQTLEWYRRRTQPPTVQRNQEYEHQRTHH
jgi:nucleoside-diphosphate-sugar epimerase